MFFLFIFRGSDCRAEPKQWVKLKGTFKVEEKERTDVMAMQTPAAFLVQDEERIAFNVRLTDTK